MRKHLYQMRVNSLGVLVWDRLTQWESSVYRVRRFMRLPTRSGVVSRSTPSALEHQP